MTSALSDSLLCKFSNFISNEIGLYFPKQKWRDLERGIEAASQAFQFDDTESCIHWLMSSSLNRKQTEILASVLTVGETYFFRDMNIFRILEENILPPLIYKRYQENQKRLRIWSAGCASGEEPYSIAVVLHKLIPDIKNWNITLLSTDINTVFLKKLSIGIYSEWSFRGVSDEIKTAYFEKNSKGQYKILPKIKRLVEPYYLNLAQDSYPSLMNNTNAMDIIFCRNVLMYFSPKLIQKVIKNFFACLVNDGCLIVGAGEVSQPYFSDFKREVINSVTVYKRMNLEMPKIAGSPVELNMPEIIVEKRPEKIIPDYKAITQEYANQGKLQEALSWNDKAISKSKTDAELYYLRAMILLELNNHAEAMTALNRVLYLDSKYIQAYIVLGNIFQKKKKIREAEKHFEYALTLLTNMNHEEMIENITAGRLIEIIRSMREME